MSTPMRFHRVKAFCDWLDTVPPQPPFHTRPEFEFYSDLSDAEMSAAQAEMQRRGNAAQGEADELKAVRGSMREFEHVCWEAVAWLKAAREDPARGDERIRLSEDTADVLLLFIDHLAAMARLTPPNGSEAA